jgi:hypothetical protein
MKHSKIVEISSYRKNEVDPMSRPFFDFFKLQSPVIFFPIFATVFMPLLSGFFAFV